MNDDTNTLDQIARILEADNPSRHPGVLTAWITIAEYATADGARYIVTRNGTSPDSDHTTTPWQRRGMLHEVLDTGLVDDEYEITFEADDADE